MTEEEFIATTLRELREIQKEILAELREFRQELATASSMITDLHRRLDRIEEGHGVVSYFLIHTGGIPRGSYLPPDPQHTGRRGLMRQPGGFGTDRDGRRAPYEYG